MHATLRASTLRAFWRALTGGLIALACAVPASAQIVLKASHQFPGGKGDARAEMVEVLAREVEKANVGLKIAVYPDAKLYKPLQQWDALTKGELDISSFPLDYASDKHPQFSATLMPGLVRSYDRAERLNRSPFMRDIKAIIEGARVVVLADAWLSGAFASKKGCIMGPDTVKDLSIRAAGPAFEQMLSAAGARIVSMPSSDIHKAMQDGRLDATNTSSESFVSFRLFEQVKCLSAPGANALWFMYEPVLMSKQVFDRLNAAQRKALLDAGRKAEAFFNAEARRGDQKMVEVFRQAGVQVTEMSRADYDAWLAVARRSAYANFATKVPGGDDLIRKALSVD